jgi:hypothetical protein
MLRSDRVCLLPEPAADKPRKAVLTFWLPPAAGSGSRPAIEALWNGESVALHPVPVAEGEQIKASIPLKGARLELRRRGERRDETWSLRFRYEPEPKWFVEGLAGYRPEDLPRARLTLKSHAAGGSPADRARARYILARLPDADPAELGRSLAASGRQG